MFRLKLAIVKSVLDIIILNTLKVNAFKRTVRLKSLESKHVYAFAHTTVLGIRKYIYDNNMLKDFNMRLY
jgi:hypothetical protein